MSVRDAFIVLAVAAVANAGLNLRWSYSSVPGTFPSIAACADEPFTFSCENTTAIQNTCCSPTPGGLVLQTQIWSTHTGYESRGQLLPKDSWTIHGLWPDNCDGSYESYCDLARQYDPNPVPATLPDGTAIPPYDGPGVDKFVKEFRRTDLLDYMEKYWVSSESPNAQFWAHEFSKHATWTSTFDVACYGDDYQENQDVVDFFLAFPTYQMLAAGGIVPSNTTTYSLGQIQKTLKAQSGALSYLGCGNNGTVLQEVWYFNHVSGTEQFGRYKAVDATTETSCSETEGIYYYERSPRSEHEVRY